MKSLIILLFLPLIVCSCETSFDIEAEEKEIPVIYGVLDKNESKQYLRIERAFQSNGSDVLKLAKDPDVLYYEDGKALLINPATGKFVTGTKVDGDEIGLKRQNGIFLQSPNILYEFPTTDWNINPPSKIIFSFESPSLKKAVTAEIPIIKELQLREGVPASPINMGYDRNISVGWNNSIEAKVFDLVMRINYQEKNNQTNGLFVSKTLDWQLQNNYEAEMDFLNSSFTFKGIEFYKFLGNSLTSSSDIQRNIKSVDLILTAGGIAFKEVLSLNQANYGLSGATIIPRYNNISNGIGFLSSRLKVLRTNISLSAVTLDSLKNGIYTKALKFN